MYCIKFYKRGNWVEMANTRRKYKAELVPIANRLNKEMLHEYRIAFFDGRRYRIRRAL